MMNTSKHNPFVEIFKDIWDEFKQKYAGYATEYYDEVVEKMINCGDPNYGYVEYGCLNCGGHKHRVAFTCKCSLCLRCGRVRSENFVCEVMDKLHSGVIYRHLILTIPDQLKKLFYQRRHDKDFYNAFYKVGFEYIQDVFEYVSGKKLKCGAIIVLHITGRKGNYRPHLHIIVMNGGIDIVTGKWVNIGYFPYKEILPTKWQWHLLSLVKSNDLSVKTKKLVKKLWKIYKNGFYNNFKKGDVPTRSKYLVKYLSKYLFRPQVSVKRIKNYDSKNGMVTYEYADHRTGRVETEEISAIEFIGRMMQQVLPKGFHRVKYYGLQATKSFEKSKETVSIGLESVDSIVFKKDESVFKVPQNNYRSRIKEWTGKDPLTCPHCQNEMELIKIWSVKKGTIYDLLEEYRKQATAPPDELVGLQEVIPSEPIDCVNEYYEQLDFMNLAA